MPKQKTLRRRLAAKQKGQARWKQSQRELKEANWNQERAQVEEQDLNERTHDFIDHFWPVVDELQNAWRRSRGDFDEDERESIQSILQREAEWRGAYRVLEQAIRKVH
jgi:molecular chaperone GrpE (heat shock protein)